jgi:CBS domain containing-hemolysin-like protein
MPADFDLGATLWRLATTFLFVALNGFFVAAEFALVKVRPTRIDALAQQGNRRARRVMGILEHLDLYLSSCQLGITVASLILGWLAEPAIAALLIGLAGKLGIVASPALIHGVSLGIALATVTILHMTIGEQAPKILAIHRPEPMALAFALPLRIFTGLLKPLIGLINLLSNLLLRPFGIRGADEHGEGAFSADELKSVLAASSQAGHISSRQRQFGENILGFINLEVRHILVPRVEVVELSTEDSLEKNLQTIRETRHTRFPLCGEGELDNVKGIVHAKEVLRVLTGGGELDLEAISRKPLFVPDTQPLARLIYELQRAHTECAIVVDEHGTAVGLAFLEDALEEIVGPLSDEFDEVAPMVQEIGPDITEVDGRLPLPEAVQRFGIEAAEDDDEDTIGGYIVSQLKRLPRRGDELTIERHKVTVTQVERRMARRLRFELATTPAEEGAPLINDAAPSDDDTSPGT